MGNEIQVDITPHVVDETSLVCAGIVKESFDLGVVILAECFKGAADGDDAKLVPALVFRNVCRHLLATAVLAREGLAEACNLTVRALLESSVSLLYMIEGESDKKAAAFRVMDVLDGISLADEISPFTKEGKELRTELHNDRMGKLDSPLFDQAPGSRKELETILGELRKNSLCEAAYRDYERIMQEERKGRGGRRVMWYWLFGGPRSFRKLAKKTRMLYSYATVYYLTSKSAHGVDALRHAAVPVKHGVTNIPIVSSKDIDSLMAAAINLAMITYADIIPAFCPSMVPAYNAWLQNVRATLIKLGLYPASRG